MTEHVIYILSGNQPGPIFIGVTSNMTQCLRRHRAGKVSRAEFRIDRLVYTEAFNCSFKADARLRALKSASREWVEALITASNPAWKNGKEKNCESQELRFQPIELSKAA